MKKLLLSLSVLFSLGVFAQSVDLKMTLMKPTDGFKIIADVPFDVEYEVKNIGTTSLDQQGDSIIMVYFLGNIQLTAGGQSPRIITNRTLAPGDTIWGKYTVTFPKAFMNQLGINGPTNGDFCVRVFAQNGDGRDSATDNNLDCSSITLPVKEVQQAAATVQVYPNPARETLNITMTYAKPATINVMDITGRAVKTVSMQNGEARIDVTTMNKGVYLYQIMTESGDLIKSGKFTIAQ